MPLLLKGMWNRGTEGHVLLAITTQLAEWIDTVSWMTTTLQIETVTFLLYLAPDTVRPLTITTGMEGIVKQQIDSHITDPDQQNNGLS